MKRIEPNAGNKFERIIRFFPAFDRRHPEPSKNYGIGSVNVLFVLKGKEGAATFTMSSGWYLPQQISEHGHKPWKDWQPRGHCVSYCSPTPKFEGQTSRDNCPWINGKPCYSDGSFLVSDNVLDALIREGEEGVWSKLEEFYADNFHPAG